MLTGEGNENAEKKKTKGLITRKSTLHVQHNFFVHFFAVVLHDYSVKLPETSRLHISWRNCHTCSCSLFFFHCCSLSPWWLLAFLIFSPTYKISCCSSNKKCLLCFLYLALALFLVELRWPVTLLSLFLCLSLFLFSKFVDIINLNLIP